MPQHKFILKHFPVGVNIVHHLKKSKKDIFMIGQRTGHDADYFLETIVIWHRLSEHKANT